MKSQHTYHLSDIIPLLQVSLRECLLREPITDEWKEAVQSFCEQVDSHSERMKDRQKLTEEIREKIDTGILSEPGIKQYSNWLENTLINPVKSLFDEANETLQNPIFDLKNKHLRASIEPTLYPEERLNSPLLSEDDREVISRRFVKALRILKDVTNSIRQIAQLELKRVTYTVHSATLNAENSSSIVKNKQVGDRKKRASTEAREHRLKESVDNYISIEGMNRQEAMKKAAQKEGCSADTVERAVGWKRRY